jgi:hypothetical protein
MLGLSIGFDLSRVFPFREVGERIGRAFCHASWLFPKVNSLDTEAAFSHHVLS